MRPIPLDGALYSLVMSYSGSRRPRGHSRANAPRAALTPRDRETCPGNSTWVVDLRQIPYACHALPTAAATSVRSLALYKARCSSIPYLAGLPLASHQHRTYIPDIPAESPTLAANRKNKRYFCATPRQPPSTTRWRTRPPGGHAPRLFPRAQGSTAAPPERAGPRAGAAQRGYSGAGQAL